MAKKSTMSDAERRRQERDKRRAQAARNPYVTTSAAKRRAEARAKSKTVAAVGDAATVRAKNAALDPATLARLLHNPTKTVPVETLRQQYAYVLKDLRSMAILAVALIVVLFVMAAVLL